MTVPLFNSLLICLGLEILLYGASPKCEDVDRQALTYSEIKALCTSDERIKEKLMLENEVNELKTLAAEYGNTVYEMQDKIKAFPMKEEQLTAALSNLQADRKVLKALPFDPETKSVFTTLTAALNLAAIEAMKNAPKREQTCYFQRAQLKRDAARIAKKKSAPKKSKDQDKNKKKPGLE